MTRPPCNSRRDLAERVVATGSRGVLIDIAALDIVDSFVGRMLSTAVRRR